MASTSASDYFASITSEINLKQHIQSILLKLNAMATTLTKFAVISDDCKLLDHTKGGVVVTSNRNAATTINHRVTAIHIGSINLMYDLIDLCNYPNVTMVELDKSFQVTLPFATSEDAKLVFPQVTTIIVNVCQNGRVTDVLPIAQSFPNIDTVVLVSDGYKLLSCKESQRCIKDIKCSTLVLVNDFCKFVKPSFMQHLAEILAMNEHVPNLVIVNQNKKSIVIDTKGVVFKHPIRVRLVRLRYVNADGCDLATFDDSELDL
ncbi:Hypothetical protein MVR_LOCUS386 [uncultured virus]|nr:Hypothetical protein MVR_LOCUS386 [uncultured virus]